MSDVEAAALLREVSDRIEARTGYRAFGYVSAPTPHTRRIIVGVDVFSSWVEAGGRLAEMERDIESGVWDHWNCRGCPWSFSTEAERDEHERGHR